MAASLGAHHLGGAALHQHRRDARCPRSARRSPRAGWWGPPAPPPAARGARPRSCFAAPTMAGQDAADLAHAAARQQRERGRLPGRPELLAEVGGAGGEGICSTTGLPT